MRAASRKEPIDHGVRIEVTGSGRTLAAIQRMVPDHAHDIDGMHGWSVRTAAMPNGEILTVTSSDAAEVEKIRTIWPWQRARWCISPIDPRRFQIGRDRVARKPPPGRLASLICPPCAWATENTMDRPSPTPPVSRLRDCSRR